MKIKDKLLCMIGKHDGVPIFILHPKKIGNPRSTMSECTRCGKVLSPYGWAKIK